MSLETIITVEYGGQITLVTLRNSKDQESRFAIRDSVPLRVGYKVEVKKTSRIIFTSGRQKQEFQRIQEMDIYDDKTLIGNYKEKKMDCTTTYSD